MTTVRSRLSPMPCKSLHSFRPISSLEGDEVVHEGGRYSALYGPSRAQQPCAGQCFLSEPWMPPQLGTISV